MTIPLNFHQDIQSLTTPNLNANWAHAELEYVYDNTLPVALNLNVGTRLKVFGEYYKQLDIQQSNLSVIGLDVRHYIRIHREIIWANRFSASTSLGPDKLIYYMGGVDNWLPPNFQYYHTD